MRYTLTSNRRWKENLLDQVRIVTRVLRVSFLYLCVKLRQLDLQRAIWFFNSSAGAAAHLSKLTSCISLHRSHASAIYLSMSMTRPPVVLSTSGRLRVPANGLRFKHEDDA